MPTIIEVKGLSKHYRLGLIGGGTLREDLSRWWANLRGKPDPMLKVDAFDQSERKGGEIWALKDISFSVNQGEILGIIGRNGAGKSTLLKILSRITLPTKGQALIKGRVASLLEVGTGFHPELTGRENIYLNGAILGMSKAEVAAKLDEIIEFAEISQFIDTPVKRYSSGMTVRLAFSVAAHLEPEILIVDEVLAVGDKGFQEKCIGKLNAAAGSGRTVLFVSHQLHFISSLCSRALLIDDGRVVKDDSADAVIETYLKSLAGKNTFYSDNAKDSKPYQYLREVRPVCNGNNNGVQTEGIFSFDQEINIIIKYIVPEKKYFVAMTIDNTKGVRVFSGWDVDQDSRPRLQAGELVEVMVTVPAKLLSPDAYIAYVDVDTFAHGHSLSHESTQILFEVNEIGFAFEGGRATRGNRPVIWNATSWAYAD